MMRRRRGRGAWIMWEGPLRPDRGCKKSSRGAKAPPTFSEPNPLQTQRVRDYRDGAQAHRSAGDDRTEEPAEERIENSGGDRDPKGVVNEREEKVLPDIAHDGAAEMDRLDDAVQVAFHESDSGAFHGNVGAGSHRDTD